MLHMPSPMLLNAGGKSYEDFRSHIATLATAPSRVPQHNVGQFITATSSVRVTLDGGTTAYMTGSSWNSRFQAVGTTFLAAIWHAMPSQAVFNAQNSQGLEVLITITVPGSQQTYSALSRNGLQSDGGTLDQSYTYGRVTRLLRWDAALGKAFESNPSIGGAETEYLWG